MNGPFWQNINKSESIAQVGKPRGCKVDVSENDSRIMFVMPLRDESLSGLWYAFYFSIILAIAFGVSIVLDTDLRISLGAEMKAFLFAMFFFFSLYIYFLLLRRVLALKITLDGEGVTISGGSIQSARLKKIPWQNIHNFPIGSRDEDASTIFIKTTRQNVDMLAPLEKTREELEWIQNRILLWARRRK